MSSKASLAPRSSPQNGEFLNDVLEGLSARPKSIPCKYLYDARGSELYLEICRLPEYYPARVEPDILRSALDEIRDLAGPRCSVIEPGSGASVKTRILLEGLESPSTYIPIDINSSQLSEAAGNLRRDFPDLEVRPVTGDYTRPVVLPQSRSRSERTLFFFPGSTVGNFEPLEAGMFLRRWRRKLAAGDLMLIGVDLEKPRAILEAAYDDSRGVTAAFNLNLLARLNRELGAGLSQDGFRHRAVYRPECSRVEMHLVSRLLQKVHLGDIAIEIERNEAIVTEHSYKYTIETFAAIAEPAGFQTLRTWTDPEGLFSLQAYEAR